MYYYYYYRVTIYSHNERNNLLRMISWISLIVVFIKFRDGKNVQCVQNSDIHPCRNIFFFFLQFSFIFYLSILTYDRIEKEKDLDNSSNKLDCQWIYVGSILNSPFFFFDVKNLITIFNTTCNTAFLNLTLSWIDTSYLPYRFQEAFSIFDYEKIFH